MRVSHTQRKISVMFMVRHKPIVVVLCLALAGLGIGSVQAADDDKSAKVRVYTNEDLPRALPSASSIDPGRSGAGEAGARTCSDDLYDLPRP